MITKYNIKKLELDIAKHTDTTSINTETQFLTKILNKREDVIINFSGSPDEKTLPFISKSLDAPIVKQVNDLTNLRSDIEEFLSLEKKDVAGKDCTKRLCIEMLRLVHKEEYRETYDGNLVYTSLTKLVESSRCTQFTLSEYEHLFDVNTIDNCYSYLLLAISPESSFAEFSDSVSSILRMSSISTQNVQNALKVEIEIVEDTTNNSLKDKMDSNDREVEEKNGSIASKLLKSGMSLIKWSLFSNKLVLGAQLIGYSAVIGVSGKYLFIPIMMKSIGFVGGTIISSKPSKLELTENVNSDLSIRELLNQLFKKLIDKLF